MIRIGDLQKKAFASKVRDTQKARWEGSLADQMQDLPDFEEAMRALNKHLRIIP